MHPNTPPRACLTPLLLITCAVLAGCGRTLMPTPNVHRDPDVNRFADVPAERRSNSIEIMYCTDRSPSSEPGQPVRYGSGRSTSMAIGTTRVRIGAPSLTWDELVAASRTGRRKGRLGLRHLDTTELARMPATPWYVQLPDDPDVTEAIVRDRWLRRAGDAQGIIDERLREAAGGDVFVFVHGFNNTFGDAAMTLAELWHFLGRRGVAILYSWPAASAGAFGYNPDRESSEFTVAHFKHFIQVVAGCTEVERIHLIAHSRGTDVLTSAIRELHIQHSAGGLDTAEELKLENLVMIAGDIDQEVFDQRFGAESVWRAAGHVTIYTGAGDVALDMASNMFRSRGRMGQLDTDTVTEAGRIVLDYLADSVSIVHQPRRSGLTGHGYHTSDPGASSDLVLLLLGHQRPGAAHGRPLEQHSSGVWIIPDGYPGN